MALISVHLGLVFKQKHTQWPGPGRTNDNVVGERMFPALRAQAGRLLHGRLRRDRADGRPVPDQPDLAVRPVRGVRWSRPASQPDWYVMFLDGSTRLMPAWEISIPIGDGYVIPPLFWPTVVLPGILTVLPMFYPFIEARLPQGQAGTTTCSSAPGTCPARTALGAMAIAFYVVLTALRRQRRDRRQVPHQPERDDLGRPGRPADRPAAGLLRHVPDLPRPAAARPGGAGPRRGDRHHQAAAGRPVRRGAPAAHRGRRQRRPRRAGLRRLGRCRRR